MEIKRNIVLRKDSDGALLFNPDDGSVTRLNATGIVIWHALEEGLEGEALLQRLLDVFGESAPPPKVLSQDVEQFLGMLSHNGYISGYKGVDVAPSEVVVESLPSDQAFYERQSMLRVFVPGDALVMEDKPFDAFTVGDVVAFFPEGLQKPGIVHRCIRRDGASLVTMGDNNDSPDSHPVTIADHPRLVAARIRPDGKRLAVANGAAGMRKFRINRLRRMLRLFCSRCVKLLLPLMFWRINVTSKVLFPNSIQYYYNDKLVARRVNGSLTFVPVWKKLFYKVEDNKLHYYKSRSGGKVR